MTKETLTGNTRYRIHTQMFGRPLLVLQVEVRETGDYVTNGGGQCEVMDIDNTFFRDASIEDITKVETDG